MYTFTFNGKIYSNKDINKLQKLLEKNGYKGNVVLELVAASQETIDNERIYLTNQLTTPLETKDVADVEDPGMTEDPGTEVYETPSLADLYDGIDNEGKPLN
jgi:hypothetical protein